MMSCFGDKFWVAVKKSARVEGRSVKMVTKRYRRYIMTKIGELKF